MKLWLQKVLTNVCFIYLFLAYQHERINNIKTINNTSEYLSIFSID